MRHRFPLLALAFALAASSMTGAAAAATWAPGYADGPWDALTAGPAGELWVNLQDAGLKRKATADERKHGAPEWVWDGWKKSGTVPLYRFKEKSRAPNPDNQGTAISFDSWPTRYQLVLNGGNGKVVKTGDAAWSEAAQPESFFQAPGTRYIVSEGTGPSPDQPAAKPGHKPGHKPVRHPARKPARKPGHKPSRKPGAPTPAADIVDLTPRELSWLTLKQRSDYRAAVSAAAADKAAHLQANKKYRDVILNTNLRKEAVSAYQAVTSVRLSSAAIEDALDPAKVKPYDGAELALNDEELGLLEKITKDKAPAGVTLRGANAKADYLEEKRLVDAEKESDSSPDRVAEHLLAQKYRDLYAKAGLTPTKDPGTGNQASPTTSPVLPNLTNLPLAAGEKGLLSDKERIDYETQLGDLQKQLQDAQARGDQQAAAGLQQKIDDLNRKFRGIAFDRFNAMDKGKKKGVCDGLSKTQAAGNTSKACSEFANSDVSAETCNRLHPPVPSTGGTEKAVEANTQAQKDQQAALAQCIANVDACKSSSVAGSAGGGVASLNEPFKSACECLIADCTTTAGGNGGDHGRGSKIDKMDPASAPGSDKDTDAKKKDKDKNFQRNMAAGMASAMFGIVLGSFFGGPLLFLGAGALLGLGGYFMSRHFNPPTNKKKDGDG